MEIGNGCDCENIGDRVEYVRVARTRNDEVGRAVLLLTCVFDGVSRLSVGLFDTDKGRSVTVSVTEGVVVAVTLVRMVGVGLLVAERLRTTERLSVCDRL